MMGAFGSDQSSTSESGAASAEARTDLLTEIDFKWLMAGAGWWVDMVRFQQDPAYAAQFLRSALASPCGALRDCAALLQARLAAAA